MSSLNVLKQPGPLTGGALIAPSILSADFAEMGDECEAVLGGGGRGGGGADLLHLDVMDGHFVPNLTMGPALCRSLRRRFPKVCLDVHVMISDPAEFIRPFADAGATNYTFHVEAVHDPSEIADETRRAGMSAGIAINPPTKVEKILPYVQAADVILIMSVNPGFSGQSFIAEVLDKARRIKPMLRPTQRLEIDGGVNIETAAACREAGCDVLVAASAIFGAKSRRMYPRIIADLRGDSPRRSRSTRRKTKRGMGGGTRSPVRRRR